MLICNAKDKKVVLDAPQTENYVLKPAPTGGNRVSCKFHWNCDFQNWKTKKTRELQDSKENHRQIAKSSLKNLEKPTAVYAPWTKQLVVNSTVSSG